MLECSGCDQVDSAVHIIIGESPACEKYLESQVSIDLDLWVLDLGELKDLWSELCAELNWHELESSTQKVEHLDSDLLGLRIHTHGLPLNNLTSSHNGVQLDLYEILDARDDTSKLPDRLILQNDANGFHSLLLHHIFLGVAALLEDGAKDHSRDQMTPYFIAMAEHLVTRNSAVYKILPCW